MGYLQLQFSGDLPREALRRDMKRDDLSCSQPHDEAGRPVDLLDGGEYEEPDFFHLVNLRLIVLFTSPDTSILWMSSGQPLTTCLSQAGSDVTKCNFFAISIRTRLITAE